jgi:hypothetical protein
MCAHSLTPQWHECHESVVRREENPEGTVVVRPRQLLAGDAHSLYHALGLICSDTHSATSSASFASHSNTISSRGPCTDHLERGERVGLVNPSHRVLEPVGPGPLYFVIHERAVPVDRVRPPPADGGPRFLDAPVCEAPRHFLTPAVEGRVRVEEFAEDVVGLLLAYVCTPSEASCVRSLFGPAP